MNIKVQVELLITVEDTLFSNLDAPHRLDAMRRTVHDLLEAATAPGERAGDAFEEAGMTIAQQRTTSCRAVR